MDFLLENPAMIWLALAIVFMIAEGITVALVTIWFVGGALAAMLVAYIGATSTLQIVVFFVVSLLLLWLVRPYMRKQAKEYTPTNADEFVGKKGVVTRPSSEFRPGQGRVKNQIWTIEAEDHRALEMDETFEVLEIRGVKLIVK